MKRNKKNVLSHLTRILYTHTQIAAYNICHWAHLSRISSRRARAIHQTKRVYTDESERWSYIRLEKESITACAHALWSRHSIYRAYMYAAWDVIFFFSGLHAYLRYRRSWRQVTSAFLNEPHILTSIHIHIYMSMYMCKRQGRAACVYAPRNYADQVSYGDAPPLFYFFLFFLIFFRGFTAAHTFYDAINHFSPCFYIYYI